MKLEKIDNFDEFIIWLKKDGLSPKRSERLWKKKIFANLVNEHAKTLENYNDFLISKILKNTLGKKVYFQKIDQVIEEVDSIHNYFLFKTVDSSIIKVKKSSLDLFISNHIRED